MLFILCVLSVFQSVSPCSQPCSGNCINYDSIEDDKQQQTQKKVREGQIRFLMDCKIIFCHLRFSFLEVKWLLKVFSSTFRKKQVKNKYLCTHLFNYTQSLCIYNKDTKDAREKLILSFKLTTWTTSFLHFKLNKLFMDPNFFGFFFLLLSESVSR